MPTEFVLLWRMGKKQLIEELAERYVRNRRLEGGTNMAMVRGAIYHQVWSYMRRWLADHGELPTGEHIVPGGMHFGRSEDRLPWASRDAQRIDFSKLANDPDYPRPRRDRAYVAPEDRPPLYKLKRR